MTAAAPVATAQLFRPAPTRWAPLLVLVALLLGLLLLPQARAEGVELNQLSTARSEDGGLDLGFSTRFDLPRAAEDALMKGVPIYFVAEVSVFRNRWYWRDARAARTSRSWRLAWQPLTRQYKVSTGGLNQSYNSLSEALSSLRGVSGWRIAEPKDIEDDGRYYLEFSYQLDTSQLPRPMQIGLGSPQGWSLNIDRVFVLSADFTLRPPAP